MPDTRPVHIENRDAGIKKSFDTVGTEGTEEFAEQSIALKT